MDAAESGLGVALHTSAVGSATSASVSPALPTSSAALTGSLNLQDGNWTSQLGQDIAQLRQAGENTLKIALAPEHLGQMEMELRQRSDGSLELRMQADNAQARDLLLGQSAELRDKLQSQGMNLSHFSCTSDGQREAPLRQQIDDPDARLMSGPEVRDEDLASDDGQGTLAAVGLHIYA